MHVDEAQQLIDRMDPDEFSPDLFWKDLQIQDGELPHGWSTVGWAFSEHLPFKRLSPYACMFEHSRLGRRWRDVSAFTFGEIAGRVREKSIA